MSAALGRKNIDRQMILLLCVIMMSIWPLGESSIAWLLLCAVVQVITRILQHSSSSIKLHATDVLLSALAHDPMPLRQFLASQPHHELLDIMVQQFISSDESGLPEQIAELLKLLADPGARGVSGIRF